MWTWVTSHFVFWTGFLCAALLVVHIIRQRHTPAGTSAWLLLIILLPYFGVPLYLLFGGRKLHQMIKRKSAIHLVEAQVTPSGQSHDIDRMLRGYGIPGATAGNHTVLCDDAVAAYTRLVDLISEATDHIHITTYVFKNDMVGKEVIALLAKRASEGVEVRLLLDSFGSFRLWRWSLRPLLKAGGRVEVFMPVFPMSLRGRTNLRNHRKIAIFDDKKVWAGGANIGGEYIAPKVLSTQWKELSFVIEGPSVRLYAEIFRSDWEFASGEKLPVKGVITKQSKQGEPVQIVPSGPDIVDDPLYHAILSAVFTARKRLWIVTPYFIPETALNQALIIAARKGVDVSIVVPRRSNHILTDMARGTYLRELQQNGINIVFYPRMIHAKALLMDDELAIVGSANIDIRSLLYNFEVGTFFYGKHTIEKMDAWMEELIKKGNTVTLKAGILRDMAESLMRLISPVL